MSVIRHRKRDRDFLQLHNSVVNDPNLSFKAKGILAYIVSKPDSWVVRINDLCNHSTDGEESIRSGLKNLQQHGYARLVRGGENGGGYWEVFETPCLNPESKKNTEMAVSAISGGGDMAVYPISGKPNFGFSDPSNTDVLAIQDSLRKKEVHIPPKGENLTHEETIYKEYPLKAAKPAALKAIRKALEKHPFEYLLEKTKQYAEIRGGNMEFVPHPATWFNQERYDDSPATWYPSSRNGEPTSTNRYGMPE